MGVNDLGSKWASEVGIRGNGAVECGSDLLLTAQTCWRPVSEPPTEADADENSVVLVWVPKDEDGPETIMVWPWHGIKKEPGAGSGLKWARIRDVVLLPPEDE